jgi:hypothetical protein
MHTDEDSAEWSHDFRQLMASVNVTSHKVTSLLSLLAAALRNGHALPPYLEMPEPFGFQKEIENIDKDILNIRHFAEPEYSAFAAMQIVSDSMNKDLHKLTR